MLWLNVCSEILRHIFINESILPNISRARSIIIVIIFHSENTSQGWQFRSLRARVPSNENAAPPECRMLFVGKSK
jgi:hypothetical protein